MNPDIKERWVAALRSGRYRQCEGTLRTDDNAFCAIGVLCDVVAPDAWENEGHSWYYDIPEEDYHYDDDSGGTGWPSRRVIEEADIAETALNTIVLLNDEEHCSFEDIAQWIAANL